MNDSQVFFLCGMWKLPTIFQRPCCCLCLGSKVDKSFTEKAQSWLFFQFLGGTCDNSANMTQQIQFFESPVWCVIQFLKWLWSQVFWGPSNHHKVSSHSFRSHTMFKGPKKEIIKKCYFVTWQNVDFWNSVRSLLCFQSLRFKRYSFLEGLFEGQPNFKTKELIYSIGDQCTVVFLAKYQDTPIFGLLSHFP